MRFAMIHFNQDPHTGGYVYLPLKGVSGYFAAGQEVLPVVKALTAAGFEHDRIEVFKGQQGADLLDFEGKRHGLWVRFMRKLEDNLTDDAYLFHNANEILRSGGSIVAVFPHGGEAEWRLVGKILKDHSATDVTHWGRMVVETI